jgi:hypothetical protein
VERGEWSVERGEGRVEARGIGETALSLTNTNAIRDY